MYKMTKTLTELMRLMPYLIISEINQIQRFTSHRWFSDENELQLSTVWHYRSPTLSV